jgi:hypothetical protein
VSRPSTDESWHQKASEQQVHVEQNHPASIKLLSNLLSKMLL